MDGEQCRQYVSIYLVPVVVNPGYKRWDVDVDTWQIRIRASKTP